MSGPTAADAFPGASGDRPSGASRKRDQRHRRPRYRTGLANLGAPVAAEAAPAGPAAHGTPALLNFDLDAAKRFLHACMTSHPRVTYGLGKKVPFHGAIPGRDFTQVDCSGFVREAVRLATNPPAPFPDGSVVQHDWVRAQGFAASSVIDAGKDDGSSASLSCARKMSRAGSATWCLSAPG